MGHGPNNNNNKVHVKQIFLSWRWFGFLGSSYPIKFGFSKLFVGWWEKHHVSLFTVDAASWLDSLTQTYTMRDGFFYVQSYYF